MSCMRKIDHFTSDFKQINEQSSSIHVKIHNKGCNLLKFNLQKVCSQPAKVLKLIIVAAARQFESANSSLLCGEIVTKATIAGERMDLFTQKVTMLL